MLFWRFVRFASLITTLSWCGLLPAQSGVMGTWREPTGSAIEIFSCADKVCLRLVSISMQAPTQFDEHNPDATPRTRALCGLVIGSGFHLQGNDKADGGSLYDPKTGKTYKGTMTRQGEQLNLRGYLGIKLFGVTEVWQRVSMIKPCSVPSELRFGTPQSSSVR